MFDAMIKIRKEYQKFNFDNGDIMEVQGIRLCLAPKVEKFVILENITRGSKSNLELLEYCNPNLAQWYHNVSVGSELTLKEYHSETKHIPVSDKDGGITEIYSNSENSL